MGGSIGRHVATLVVSTYSDTDPARSVERDEDGMGADKIRWLTYAGRSGCGASCPRSVGGAPMDCRCRGVPARNIARA